MYWVYLVDQDGRILEQTKMGCRQERLREVIDHLVTKYEKEIQDQHLWFEIRAAMKICGRYCIPGGEAVLVTEENDYPICHYSDGFFARMNRDWIEEQIREGKWSRID